jgi:hypothetical protein
MSLFPGKLVNASTEPIGIFGRALQITDDLVELWNWYEAGHWPAGFATWVAGIPGPDGGSSRRLLVY